MSYVCGYNHEMELILYQGELKELNARAWNGEQGMRDQHDGIHVGGSTGQG
jgi:hypothetical protein